jgi:hypothetical protein
MRKLTLLLSCVLFALSAQGLRPQEPSPKPDIFYLPTPQRVVDVMLLMAEVKKDDMLYDLGSGDGRLVITAAKRYGARGIGIEIDPRLLTVATRNAFRAKVEDKAQFREADLFTSDFKDATVITLYLLDTLNERLRPQIFAQVKPGTRIVSHAFRMGDWIPDAERKLTIDGRPYEAFFWVVPANISGRWKLTGTGKIKGLPGEVVVEQTFQDFIVRTADGSALLGEGKVNGSEFYVTLPAGSRGKPTRFTGTIEGNRIDAVLPEQGLKWQGEREPGSEKPLEPVK